MTEKKKWFQRLLDTQNRISVEKHKEYIGRILPVLVEEENPADAVNNLNCRTDGWRLVHVPGDVSAGSAEKGEDHRLFHVEPLWGVCGGVTHTF